MCTCMRVSDPPSAPAWLLSLPRLPCPFVHNPRPCPSSGPAPLPLLCTCSYRHNCPGRRLKGVTDALPPPPFGAAVQCRSTRARPPPKCPPNCFVTPRTYSQPLFPKPSRTIPAARESTLQSLGPTSAALPLALMLDAATGGCTTLAACARDCRPHATASACRARGADQCRCEDHRNNQNNLTQSRHAHYRSARCAAREAYTNNGQHHLEQIPDQAIVRALDAVRENHTEALLFHHGFLVTRLQLPQVEGFLVRWQTVRTASWVMQRRAGTLQVPYSNPPPLQ